MVGRYYLAAVPVATLHCDLVTQRIDELIADRGRKPAKFDRGPIAAQCSTPNRLLVGIDASEAVEKGQPRVIVIGVPYSLDRLADFQAGEFERTRAENVLLIPARILVEYRLFVNEAEGIGERGQKCSGRKFQV